ncbi:hypothetical protein GBA52_021849 [Prunus armeniaca]|nr:hypothetical protein GBA52_021849 [Prunus armeniaca]
MGAKEPKRKQNSPLIFERQLRDCDVMSPILKSNTTIVFMFAPKSKNKVQFMERRRKRVTEKKVENHHLLVHEWNGSMGMDEWETAYLLIRWFE